MSIKTTDQWYPLEIQPALSSQRKKDAFMTEIYTFFKQHQVIFTDEKTYSLHRNHYQYMFDVYHVYVADNIHEEFIQKFGMYISDNIINYDNLINLCIMVKNAGDGFEDILTRNLSYIDRYTILDTGSTDNTLAIIKKVLSSKRGNIYQEPFINFRDSRNRLLDLAGTDCFFNVILDDSYVIHGNLREFLDIVRGDDKADSYSIAIEGKDMLYMSNRIIKSSRGLRYVNLIHEIIQPENNLNVSIPYTYGYIEDVSSEYMSTRTANRKLQDIQILMNMVEENPLEPRTYYYIADSYLFMKDWENALKWFLKRVEYVGYKGEYQDALYYIAVIKHMYLGHPWEECHPWYLRCYETDPTRSESLYFIGEHYKKKGFLNTAFLYWKRAYELGMPEIQMSIRKDIYNFYIPKDLASLCYDLGYYALGEEACRKALAYRYDKLTDNWLHIFYHINTYQRCTNSNTPLTSVNTPLTRLSETKTIVFVSPGGWKDWDGETLRTRGLGGSENFTIRYAEQLQKMGYNIYVFCKCIAEKCYENVTYIPLEHYEEFIRKYHVDLALINRYPEYIPVTCGNNIKAYYILHDVASENDIISLNPNLLGCLCISDWHKQQFTSVFPACKDRTHVISYCLETPSVSRRKQRYMFIYPSFPNRGLIHLLRMWPSIINKYPEATLHLFCDTQNEWCQKYWKTDMEEIDSRLVTLKDTVTNHGWVNGDTLRQYWNRSHVWFYPCTFEETCCLTAWEAASSKTLVVTNDLAALKESVGERGIVIKGDASKSDWQQQALNKLFDVLDNNLEHNYIQSNYEWVLTKNYATVVTDFETRFLIPVL
jgi:tetratricopeptide (TPR) repeat protein